MSDRYTLQNDFTSAAAEFHVPASVLLAVSYQETLWDSHQGQPSSTGNYNVMGLTQVEASEIVPATKAQKEADLDAFGDGQKHPAYSAKLLADVDTVNTAVPALHTLDAAAALVKQPASALRSSMQQSVRGGAALLASYERTLHGSLPSDPGAWFAAIAEYDQASDTGTATQFADRVYATIQSGASRTTADGQLVTLTASPSVVPQSRTLAAALTPTPATSTPAPPAASSATSSAPATSPSASATSSASSSASSAASAAKPRDLAVAAATPATSTACPQVPSALAGSCTFVAANANNFDQANRPVDGDAIRYIVIHDTEASAASTINSFEDPSAGVAAHYVIAANGAVTQMVPTQDTGIHADNKTVNMHSIGIEHEGYALENGSWFSEQEYESSAELVQYLAKTYSIPLDRDHILGHDDVPYAFDSAATVTTQHVDPGTYWDWDWGYYFGLLGAPISGDGQAIVGGTVTIAPPYNDSYEPTVTGCVSYTATCSARPANFVYLRTGPSTSDPLIGDSVLSSNQMGSASTNGGDVSDKADYGQTFVVAALSGSWTAIWYGGKEAWFYNPGGAYAFANSNPGQTLVTPVGSAPVQVYGRAYPETSAYPASQSALAATAVQQVNYDLLPYTIPAGQAYTTDGEVISGDYYSYNDTYNASDSTCANTADQCEIIDKSTAGQYYQIRYNHRIGYVLASQVQTITAAAPPVGTYNPISPTRILDTRYGTGTAKAPVKAGKSISVQVEGQHGLPATGVTAVVLNVTATDATATSYVSVYPDGQSVPGVSNLNFTKNETIPNLVVVPVGADGKVDLYNSAGSVDLFADMSGYFTANGSGSGYHTVGPVRVMDTRNGTGVRKGVVGPGGKLVLQLGASNGVPLKATAAVLNVTVTDATATSLLTVYPDGQSLPGVSNLNFSKGETIPNLVVVPVIDGKVDFTNALGNVQVFADLMGYYTQ